MEIIYQSVISYITIWGYWAIFLGMALGNANIPVPSEIILGFAGYLVFAGELDATWAVTVAMLGGLFGSVVSYFIGYYGGPSFIHKYGRYVLLSEKKLVITQRWFERYGLAMTFYGRMVPFVRTFISLPAGFARVSFWKFVLYTILGSLPWTIGVLYLGVVLGENWSKLQDYGHIFTAILLVMLVGWLMVRYGRLHKLTKE
ncbi:MAG: yabI 2 [Firmicutes bacterium]|nr:yabI 2 [Bacillota bacterium]